MSVATTASAHFTNDVLVPYNIDRFNTVSDVLHLSPVSKKRKRSLKYRQNKCNGVLQALRHQIFSLPGTDDFDEMIEQLKL